MVDQESASLSYVKNIAQLLENNNEAAYALQIMQKDFVKAAVRRYNLEHEVSFHLVIEEIGKSSPEVARRLANIEKDAFKILGGRQTSPNALLRVVRALESARKELKLYD
jgi:predicted transcriptional regulator